MSYYSTCPFCGVNLDPGEKCDCIDIGLPECITVGRIEKAPVSAANADKGNKKKVAMLSSINHFT